MKKRSGYLIAVGFLLLICLGIFEILSLVPDAKTFGESVRTEKGDWYVVSGTTKEQRICRITKDGKLLGMSEAAEGEASAALSISEDEKQLFWLSEYRENGNQYYRLRIYNEDLEQTDVRKRQKISGNVSGKMYVDSGKALVTTLLDDRKTAKIHELDLTKKSASFKETESVSAAEKRFFLHTAKAGDVFYAQYDNGKTVSVKGAEQKEEKSFPVSMLAEGFDSSVKVSGGMAILKHEGIKVLFSALIKEAAVLALLFLIYSLFGRTSYRIQRFAAQELILICSLLALCGMCIRAVNTQDKEMCKKRVENSMQNMREQMKAYTDIPAEEKDYTDKEIYRNAYAKMLDIKKSGSWQKAPASISLVKSEKDAYKVVLSETTTAGSLFKAAGEEKKVLREAEGKSKVSVSLEQTQDVYMLSCAAPAGDEIAQNSYWILRVPAEKSESTAKTIRMLLIFSGAIAAAGTALLLLLLYIEGRQMKRLTEAFKASAKGEYKKENRPPHLNTEMEMLWNGMDDYTKGMERIWYQQSSQQKLYARFIPKALGMLSAEWMPEKLGAGEYISDCSIVGCLSAEGEEDWTEEQQFAVKNRNLDMLFRIQEKERVVFVPQSGNLEEIWAVFLNGARDAVHTGVRLLGDMEHMTLLVHESPYVYGVTGNETQVTPYFSAEAGKELLYYTKKLRRLHIKAAVTEQIADAFENEISMRYIGYIVLSGVNRKLYEVLEAYPASRRYAMETQNAKLSKALELYYGSDFYLARNVFAEILRECPQDEVAKWYLFACERRLGNARAADAGYGLFMED